MPEYATYVLQLKDNHYYVGKSTYLMKRLLQHFNNGGSKWTQLHKPVAVLEVHDDDLERELTLKYMRTYGMDAVRGHAWCMTTLTPNNKYHLAKTLNSF
jgi:predicted GIY-YIG superfamily endonuclease